MNLETSKSVKVEAIVLLQLCNIESVDQLATSGGAHVTVSQ